MPVNPSPSRQRVFTFLTPRIQDFLFYETKEGFRSEPPEYGTPHPDKKRWPNHKLCHVEQAEESGALDKWYYIAEREEQDLYNFSFTDADIGGSRFDAVTRTYVTLRDDFDPDAPTQGSAMPNVPVGLFSGSYVLAERKQVRSDDPKLDSLFVIEERIYLKRSSIREVGVDSLNGKALYSQTDLYYAIEVVTGSTTAAQLFAAPTNAYWGLQADGTQRVGKQLSSEWYLIETAQVVGGTMVEGVLTVDTYTSNDNYYWPPVLSELGLKTWVRNDGGEDRYPYIKFDPEGYNGPCLTTTTRTWKPTPFTIAKVDQMLPERIYYASPFFTLNVAECLHAAVTAQCDIGTEDPIYAQNVNSSETFAATNYTTWPATITAFDDQEPFRGGYLRTVKVVTKPS